jgi:hypothetical protein
MSKSEDKTLLISFFDLKGIIHYKFIPPEQVASIRPSSSGIFTEVHTWKRMKSSAGQMNFAS